MVFPNNKSLVLSEFLSGYSNEIQKGFDSIDLFILEDVVNAMDNVIKKKNINHSTIIRT